MKLRTCSLRARASALVATAVLAACGGGIGELILVTIVTPLNGAWRLDGDTTREGLQFVTPGPEVHLFTSKFDVTANLLNPSDLCGAPDDGSGQLALVGSFDNGKVVLRTRDAPQSLCIEGSITSLIRFEAVATGARPLRAYENSRVDVQMDLGLWVSDGGGTRLKFSVFNSIDNETQDSPIQACDVSPGVTPVVLDGLFDGFLKAQGKRPFIDALTEPGQAVPRFTEIEYVDGATITLRQAGGQAITLRRQREASPSECPPAPV